MVGAARFSTIVLVWLGALVLGAPIESVHAQNDWARYKPGTITAIIQLHDSTIRADHVANHPGLIVSGDDFPTLARVVYRGDSRPLNPRRIDVVREWGLTFLKDSSIVNDFHREYLFQEGKKLLWLPVQDTVASYFARELHPGQTVTLYVVWFGAYFAGGDIIWAFIVNDFKSDPVVRTF
jgi:hypothetical protein